jgi:tetratricopeptide (TPR) repeat protein
MPPDKPDRKKVFISYSHKDDYWLERLKTHLRDVERLGLLDVWEDTRIRPGANWREEINDALNSAKVAVLLISQDFIASDFIADYELPALLAAAKKDGVIILPLILSSCSYDEIEHLSDIQSVNPPSRPLVDLTKGKREKYWNELRKAVIRAIGEAEKKSVETNERENQRMLNFSIPRNRYFTGRKNILAQLHDGFKTGATAQALVGLGGVGKTQTAAQYAREFKGEYQKIFWTTARGEETLIPSYVSIARSLGLPEKDAKDQNEAVGAVKRWIETHSDWLLVLDYAEDHNVFRKYIPDNQDGHVLLTARKQIDSEIAVPNNIDTMSPQEGALFILRKLRKLKLDEPLEAARANLHKRAEELSKMLEGLPLALNQAVAYIEREHLEIEEYIELYNDERYNFLKERGGGSENDHPESVAVTFQMSFKKVSEENRAAADLLLLCAFLDADAIPEEIFRQGSEVLGEVLGNLSVSKRAFNEAVGAGNRFSLLHRDTVKKTNGINRLVQVVISHEMDADEKRLWAERAVRAVSNLFPIAEYNNWNTCDRFVQQAITLSKVVADHDFSFPEAALMLNRAGSYLSERARYDEAEKLFRHSLAIYEKGHDIENQNTASVLNNLAILSQLRGKYHDAIPFLQRSLNIYEKSPDTDDLSLARVLNNLAQLYVAQGKYEEAEPLYGRSLKIIEKVHGTESPDLGMLLNNLGELYHNQRKDDEAESSYLHSLRIMEKHFEADNPYLANVLNNLAKHYRVRGRYEEAESLYNRCLSIYEKALGDEHPDLAIVLNNLALLYRSQNKFEAAELLYKRVLMINEKAKTTDRIDFAVALENLASLYQKQGRLSEAAPLYKRSLEVYEKSLGPDHHDVVDLKAAYYALLYELDK